ncbi:MAG: tryptophan 7-halogenase [Abditibacteriales bacterium]|nr:tryptophan 7-halogenase [Abditibacteriales bacterium]MDW8364616.1 NAD(P)/FAD-dependent oxidoreductase [Abditibacteriales bacterium]
MRRNKAYDTIIIGGGPAGSTAAAVLSLHGRRVLVLEKEKFPRYHIGESLMPYCYFPLERIGVIERMKTSHFPKKYSVQFVSLNGKVSQPFYFFQHFDHPAAQTWQVLRSEFDAMLLYNARDKGATVLEETKVTQLLQDNGAVVGVKAVNKAGEERAFHAPITIDASGRDAFSVARNRWRVPDQKLKKVALWTYYKGALRDPGLDEGATTVAFLPFKGWFWYIPLPDDLVSVGIVADREYLFDETRDLATIWQREVQKNRWITQHLAPGKQVCAPGVKDGPFYTTSEWSYRSKYCAADGLVLAGDAFGFLDPVFSSGVFLALKSGELAADAVHAALVAGDVSAERFRDYGDTMRKGIEAMRKLVYAFYDHEFSMREFINQYPHLRGDLTDCLIGHLFRDFDELFARVAEFAQLPEPLPHGRPLGLL